MSENKNAFKTRNAGWGGGVNFSPSLTGYGKWFLKIVDREF